MSVLHFVFRISTPVSFRNVLLRRAKHITLNWVTATVALYVLRACSASQTAYVVCNTLFIFFLPACVVNKVFTVLGHPSCTHTDEHSINIPKYDSFTTEPNH
jgi:uncharacterized lipoprotein YajG